MQSVIGCVLWSEVQVELSSLLPPMEWNEAWQFLLFIKVSLKFMTFLIPAQQKEKQNHQYFCSASLILLNTIGGPSSCDHDLVHAEWKIVGLVPGESQTPLSLSFLSEE